MKKISAALWLILWAWTAAPTALAQRPGIPAIEKKLLEWVNKERTERQMGALKPSVALQKLAKAHSRDMASRRLLTHLSTTGKPYESRLTDAGMYFTEIGENVASSETYEGDFIHQGFMESPEHRANILNPHFDTIGIGVVLASDDKYYVTQDFLQSMQVLDKDMAAGFFKDEINKIRKEKALPSLSFQKTADLFAKNYAEKKANGKPLINIANFFGETHIHFITSPRLSLPEKVAREAAKGIYETGGVGAWFGRLPDYPGGTYMVALFLFPLNPYDEMTEDDFVKITLSALNKRREEKGLAPIRLDEKKAKQAQNISRQLKKHKESASVLPAISFRGRVFSYATEDLHIWPDNIESEIGMPNLKKIGIGVSSRKNEETRRQTFWVTLIF